MPTQMPGVWLSTTTSSTILPPIPMSLWVPVTAPPTASTSRRSVMVLDT